MLFHHALQTPNLTFNSTEPPQVRRFDPRVDPYCFAAGQFRVMRAQTFFPRILVQHVLRCSHILFVFHASLRRRTRWLFITTLTELNAIAALATTGLSSKPQIGYSAPAASGMPITL